MANPNIPVQRPILGGRRNRFGSEERVVTLARQPPRWLSNMKNCSERNDPAWPKSPTSTKGDGDIVHSPTCSLCPCTRKSTSPTFAAKVPLPTSPRSPTSPESQGSDDGSVSPSHPPDYVLQIEMDAQSSNAVAIALNDIANDEGNIYKFIVYADSSLVVVWGSIDRGSLLEMLKTKVKEVTILQAKGDSDTSVRRKEENQKNISQAEANLKHDDVGNVVELSRNPYYVVDN